MSGDCRLHTIRGGAFDFDAGALRWPYHRNGLSVVRDGDLGFRVARTLAP